MSAQQKKNVVLPFACVCGFLITFILFAQRMEAHKLFQFDSKVIRWVQSRIDNPNTRMMKIFTFLGSPLVVSIFVVSSAGFMFKKGKNREAVGMLLANATGAGFNELLKYAFRRQRPTVHRLIVEHGYSFPSGHSMGSTMFYGTLTYFLSRWTKSVAGKVIACLTSFFMVVMTGLSRIYLGVHYPSDVFAGFAAGGTWLSVCIASLHSLLSKHR